MLVFWNARGHGVQRLQCKKRGRPRLVTWSKRLVVNKVKPLAKIYEDLRGGDFVVTG